MDGTTSKNRFAQESTPAPSPKKLLVHICCSVDSHHFLSDLRALLPESELIGYFYNPNIHPQEEYEIRLLDVRRSCKMLSIALIEESYDPRDWLKESTGLEHFPEKGERCSFCFDFRLEKSAQKAKELACDGFSTTLLTSPMKSIEQLFAQGKELEHRHNLSFFALDSRRNGGTVRQQKLAKEANLYRQNYCGCLYALKAQREKSQKSASELFSPLAYSRYKEGLFEVRKNALLERNALECENLSYFWGREKRLFWHNTQTLLIDKNRAFIPTHLLAHSVHKGTLSLKVERIYSEIIFFDKEVRAISLRLFNALSQESYANIYDLIKNPPSISSELLVRQKLGDHENSVAPILVLERLPHLGESYKLTVNSFFQEESVERVWGLDS